MFTHTSPPPPNTEAHARIERWEIAAFRFTSFTMLANACNACKFIMWIRVFGWFFLLICRFQIRKCSHYYCSVTESRVGRRSLRFIHISIPPNQHFSRSQRMDICCTTKEFLLYMCMKKYTPVRNGHKTQVGRVMGYLPLHVFLIYLYYIIRFLYT